MGQPENENRTPDEQEEPNEPNEFGFAGAATGPEPNLDENPDLSDEEVAEAEEIAVPAGDITGAIVSAIEGHGDEGDEGRDDNRDERR